MNLGLKTLNIIQEIFGFLVKSHPLNPQDLRRAHLEAEQQLSLATRQAEEKITKGTWSGGLGYT